MLIVVGAVALWRRGSDLAWLAVVAVLVGILSEAHITWQIQRSKGILYVDIRHYIYLVPLIFVPIAALPRQVLILPVLLAQIWSSVPIVLETLEKPDVRGAVAYIDKYAAQSPILIAMQSAYLPAPRYEPLLEYYLLGVCDDLGHARRHEGGGTLVRASLVRVQAWTIYGFSPTPERVWASRRRHSLTISGC